MTRDKVALSQAHLLHKAKEYSHGLYGTRALAHHQVHWYAEVGLLSDVHLIYQLSCTGVRMAAKGA